MKYIFVMLITNTDGSTLYDITLPTNNYFMLKRDILNHQCVITTYSMVYTVVTALPLHCA